MRVGAGGFASPCAPWVYAKLIWRYMRCPEHEVVVVGYPGYIDILLARLLNLFSNERWCWFRLSRSMTGGYG